VHRAGELLRRLEHPGASGEALTAQEKRLQALLQSWPGGVGDRVRGADEEASLALVAFTRERVDDPATPADDTVDAAHRRAALLHGLAHAEFATRQARRQQAAAFWSQGLDEAERTRWRDTLRARGENMSDEGRMLDELQALLLAPPDGLLSRAAELGLDAAVLADQRRRFEAAASAAPPAAARR
jgi:hypothetical protein